MPRVGIDLVQPMACKWALIGSVSYKFLPSELKDSPLVEKDTDDSAALFLGVSRGF